MKLEDLVSESDCWDLPSLTTLHLSHLYSGNIYHILPLRCLTCLPSLRTLHLSLWNFEVSSLYLSLPDLTTLHLSHCQMPTKIWNLPALTTLGLNRVNFAGNMSDTLGALVSLQNLTLELLHMQDYFIPCPQLVNLEIKTRTDDNDRKGKIVVLAPKLSTFTSVGIFSITFGASKLDNVYVKLRGSIDYSDFSRKELKEIFQRFTHMLLGFGSAMILYLELATIKALSLISDFLVSSPSPFYNLKYVKLPHGYKEASLSSSLRSYLLGGSPTATIVTTSYENLIHHTAAASVTAVDNGRVVHVGAAVEGSCNDQASSSRKNIDSGLWQGNEVNSEFVRLLDQIIRKYPETFEHLDPKNKKFCTMKLNMLCTAVNEFIKIPVTEVDTETIVEYRDVLADLQKLGFNVNWLVTRLNNIEQLRFPPSLLPKLHTTDCQNDDAKSISQNFQIRIDDAKIKMQDLQTLRAEKMQEIQKAFGTMDTNLVVGYVGDDLLSGL